MKTLYAAEHSYTKEDSAQLREELIKIRDEELMNTNFGRTIVLSHVIAWMHVAMEKLFDDSR